VFSVHRQFPKLTQTIQVFSSIRNTQAFSTQDKLAKLYDEHLKVAQKWGFKSRAMVGCMLASMMVRNKLLKSTCANTNWHIGNYVLELWTRLLARLSLPS
jgi:hypothetical protein